MWFSYKSENNWHPIPVDRVNEILDLNANDKKPAGLLSNEAANVDVTNINADLEKLDKKFTNKSKNKKKRKKKRRKGGRRNKNNKSEQ